LEVPEGQTWREWRVQAETCGLAGEAGGVLAYGEPDLRRGGKGARRKGGTGKRRSTTQDLGRTTAKRLRPSRESVRSVNDGETSSKKFKKKFVNDGGGEGVILLCPTA
jgi:hypothetical protein